MKNQILLSLFFLLFLPAGRCSALAAVADINVLRQLYSLKNKAFAAKKAELNSLNIKIDTARRAPSNYFPEKGSRHETIEQLQKQIDDVNRIIDRIAANDFNLIVPVFSKGHRIGEIGRFGDAPLFNGTSSYNAPQYCKILNISDDNSALVDFMYGTAYTKFTEPSHYGYGLPREYFETIWLKGVDFSGHITGSNVIPKGLFVITGTTDYMTSEHAKFTVFIFEPLEIPDFNRL